jgi:hypothetical protein
MNAPPHPNFDVPEAGDVSDISHLPGTKTMLQDSRGSAGVVAFLCETEDRSTRSGNAAALGAADWLELAATPTFAIMALYIGLLGGGSMAHHALPLSGMVPMYLLMTVFHSPPWLRLSFSRQRGR